MGVLDDVREALGDAQPEEAVAEQEALDGKTYDCAVIGGGPAGLSAAIYMGRMRRSVVVVDNDAGRSNWHQVNRNYLGFVDGIHATSLREVGEKQASRFGVRFLLARATGASYVGEEGPERVFTVETTKGPVRARTLILCTGVSDKFPEFEGSEECIGKSMFWCIICDGYESIGKKIIVLGHNERAASLALQLKVFTNDITLVSWDESFNLDNEKLELLREHGIETHDCGCNLFTCSKGQLENIRLDNGKELGLDMVFVAQWIEPNTQLAQELGVYLDQHGYIVADAEQCTNVGGVYAAGDVTKLNNHQVTSAVHEGGMAAAAANYYLYEDWQKE
ncbi:MAG: thioredoxin reductase [Chloroflexia bacterium]|jgi:thioredoxin reductase (NADPH)|nr:thioredoxin reductase [Chloroflexia bacterium]